jgi:hypothetical protein
LAGSPRTGARSWYAKCPHFGFATWSAKVRLWKAFSGAPTAAKAAAGYVKRLEALAQAFRLLSPLTTREEVYARTVQALKASTRAVSALLFLYRPETDELELVAAAGLSAPRWGFA